MNKKVKILILALSVTVVGAVAFFLIRPSGSGLLVYVPNDAMLVAKINLPEIARIFKENEKEIKGSTLWKQAMETSNNSLGRVLQGILKDPVNSGVDFEKDLMFFIHSAQRGVNYGLLLKVRNAENFSEYMHKNTPAGSNSGKENGVDYAELGKGLFISWNEDAVLVTSQMAEGKNYFTDILNKKNPGAKGNMLLSKVEKEDGLVNIVFRFSDLFNGSDPLIKSRDFHNPFPDGTALMATVKSKPGELLSEFHLVSTNDDDLKKMNFFKTKGALPKYEKALFAKGTPKVALAISVNVHKFMDFLQAINPKFKETRNDPDFKDIENSFSGDFVMGYSVRNDILKAQMEALRNHDFEHYPQEQAISLILHVGTNNLEKLKQKLGDKLHQEDGIYSAQGLSTVYFAEINNQVVATMDKEALKEMISNHGNLVSNQTDFKIPNDHKDAPFFLVAQNGSDLFSNPLFTSMFKSLNKDVLKDMMGTGLVYLDDGHLISKTNFSNTKVEPFMLYFRLLNEFIPMISKKQMTESAETLPPPGFYGD